MSFYDNLPYNPNIDQIKEALISVVVTAQQNAMPRFKQRLKRKLILEGGNPSEDIIEQIFIMHTSDIAYAVEDVFKDDTAILNRVHSVFDNPEAAGLDAEMLDKGFYHMGFIYAMYWYGITGTAPEPSMFVGLNHIHAEAIEDALHEIDDELCEISGKPKPAPAPKKSSSLPYWILMLVVGFIIGAIIKSCS